MRQHLNRLHRLQGTNHPNQRRHHARLDAGQRILAKQTAQAAVAGLSLNVGENADLPLHADGRAGN